MYWIPVNIFLKFIDIMCGYKYTESKILKGTIHDNNDILIKLQF